MRPTITLDARHQEEPTTTGKETKQKETQALAPLMEPIIEGEVIGVIEPEQQPTRKQRPYYLIVVGTILACLIFVGVSLIEPILTPSAIVTIIPRQEHLSTTGTIQLHARLLPALTLSQSTTVSATGKRHQDATKAAGTITFYNGLLSTQTLTAGTILTGADGREVQTDEPAVIPPASNTTPPQFGEVTVSAHAIHTGEQGNIPAYDINGSCCATSVLVKNTDAFSGGQNERNFTVVSRSDIQTATTTIKTTLVKSEKAALTAQVNAGEALIPPLCSDTVTSDHQAGEEAKEVTVTLSETCSGMAYDTQTLHQNAQQLITKAALKRLGTDFRLMGDLRVSILHATVTDSNQGIVTLAVKTDETYVYLLSPGEKKRITHLIAGKSEQQAVQELFQMPAIQAASIKSNTATLPNDPGKITIIVVYRRLSLSCVFVEIEG
jgi:hypothetical protein